MHYQIPSEMLTKHFEEDVEVKPSKINRSTEFPNMDPGNGLFTKVARKKDDQIVSFPGYWMEANVYGPHAAKNKHYAFSIPKTGGWGPMTDLVYVTHECQANNINSATMGTEVILTPHDTNTYKQQRKTTLPSPHVLADAGQDECPLRSRSWAEPPRDHH